MLRVPFFKQDTDYTCGPASLQMVLAFFGDRLSERDLGLRLQTEPEKGTRHGPLISVAQEEGFQCYVNANSSLDEIRHFLRRGLPVIIDYSDSDPFDGHYSVVVAYNHPYVVLNDPWNGRHYKLHHRHFSAQWKDQITSSERWMMVLSREDFEFGRVYKPKD